MKFVLVNGRTPFRAAPCVLCCEAIGESYLRDVKTRLCYCGAGCYALHCGTELMLREGARKPREQRATRRIKGMDVHHEVRIGQP